MTAAPPTAELAGLLDAHAGYRPGAPALSVRSPSGEGTTTWSELAAEVAGARRRLRALAGPGGPTVTVLDGTAGSVVALLALLIEGADVILVEAGSSHLTDAASVVWSAGPGHIVHADRVEVAPYGCAAAVPVERPDRGDRGDPVVLQLTSGSTGEPKLARHGLANLLRGGRLYQRIFGFTPTTSIVLPVSMAHSYGVVGGLFGALVSGAALRTLPRFAPGALLGACAGADVVFGTPLVHRVLAGAGRAADLPPLLLSSGGPLPPEVNRQLTGAGPGPVHQVFGSTETGLIACSAPGEPGGPTDVGRFAPGVRWALAGTESGRGRGRLFVRTSTMFTGYVSADPREPDRTPTFYDTGDEVAVSDDGIVTVLGRKDTFINVDGKKVNPRRLQRLVSSLPGVQDSVAFGVPGALGETVHLAVQPEQGAPLTVQQLMAHCRERMAPHEVPRRVHVIDQLPRTSLGKVDAAAVRRLADGAATAAAAGPATDGDQ